MHLYMEEIHAVKWADFAGSGCLEFGFLDTIRKTRPGPVHRREGGNIDKQKQGHKKSLSYSTSIRKSPGK